MSCKDDTTAPRIGGVDVVVGRHFCTPRLVMVAVGCTSSGGCTRGAQPCTRLTSRGWAVFRTKGPASRIQLPWLGGCAIAGQRDLSSGERLVASAASLCPDWASLLARVLAGPQLCTRQPPPAFAGGFAGLGILPLGALQSLVAASGGCARPWTHGYASSPPDGAGCRSDVEELGAAGKLGPAPFEAGAVPLSAGALPAPIATRIGGHHTSPELRKRWNALNNLCWSVHEAPKIWPFPHVACLLPSS